MGVVAGLLLLIPIAPYIWVYGFHWSDSQEIWGQFGDFFGGLLNPIYAFLAFLALLYTIAIQATELKLATTEFARQADSMQKQLDHNRLSAEKEDLFKIIKDIDDDLESILQTVVSPEHSEPELRVQHIIHEGFRLRHTPNKSDSYENFIVLAKSSGSIVESVYLRLALAAGSLYRYLNMYRVISNDSSYVADYFRYKHFMVGQLLKDVGNVDKEIYEFFLSANSSTGKH